MGEGGKRMILAWDPQPGHLGLAAEEAAIRGGGSSSCGGSNYGMGGAGGQGAQCPQVIKHVNFIE